MSDGSYRRKLRGTELLWDAAIGDQRGGNLVSLRTHVCYAASERDGPRPQRGASQAPLREPFFKRTCVRWTASWNLRLDRSKASMVTANLSAPSRNTHWPRWPDPCGFASWCRVCRAQAFLPKGRVHFGGPLSLWGASWCINVDITAL